MNMQQIMAQAQRMQKDILSKKDRIDAMEFEGKSEWVIVKYHGNKEIISIDYISDEAFDKNNKEILSDMTIIAIKDAMKKIDDITEKELGSYSKMGLF